MPAIGLAASTRLGRRDIAGIIERGNAHLRIAHSRLTTSTERAIGHGHAGRNRSGRLNDRHRGATAFVRAYLGTTTDQAVAPAVLFLRRARLSLLAMLGCEHARWIAQAEHAGVGVDLDAAGLSDLWQEFRIREA